MINNWRLDIKANRHRLEKARRLYVRLCRQAIMLDRTEDTLRKVAQKMIDRGLYAPTMQLRMAELSVLRRIWKLDRGSGLKCGEWLCANGWRWWCEGSTPENPVIRTTEVRRMWRDYRKTYGIE